MRPALCFALLLWAPTVLENSCVPDAPVENVCPPIERANRVLIQGFAPDLRYVNYNVTDPEQLRRLTDFANLRQAIVQPGLNNPASVRVTATFYHGYEQLGAFGLGQDFFYVYRKERMGTRPASGGELFEFQQFIEVADARKPR